MLSTRKKLLTFNTGTSCLNNLQNSIKHDKNKTNEKKLRLVSQHRTFVILLQDTKKIGNKL